MLVKGSFSLYNVINIQSLLCIFYILGSIIEIQYFVSTNSDDQVDTFTWDEYLSLTDSIPVPVELLKPVSILHLFLS